ncbi:MULTISPECIES: cytochrome d ubiquinol oxidase subunit II [Geobacter]|uniref:Cytochrome C oxidase assembly protein n=2 Tax=Geobacter TaxID=28231 RepID=A0A0C1TNC8_9BACT|nr:MULTISPECIES: cytochrome d ubiquinol oxidase subunit II [Geobacter]ANA40379.1 cytochrome C oxidase assembly protein [Geobacter anodireducens]KIE42384.1 cytochrome C oxidase assembly protein [Geobacter soli]MBE2887101.1 cytochrome d ubiquinol oxidase subunit II [Geobacter anodireducens]HMN01325.1 cytochrome d ubiquinol oxidase subunit II [Geobacter anodireducens]
MELQITWFVLWGVLWAVYFMLDGFVLGTGILHNVIAKTDGEKRVLINAVGPVWDGNEVWLLTAGGATFAAFPTTYALMFSYLYTALLLLLFSLIIRGVAFEFRGKIESASWKKAWDVAIQVSSFLPALLFGVAFGNIFAGLPMDADGYHGSLIGLLNPYGLLTGVLFVLLFTVHGALYLSVKSVGDLSARAKGVADKVWPALLVVAVAFLAYTKFATKLYDNYLSQPVLFIVPLLAVAGLVGTRLFSAKGATLAAFAASCVTVLMVAATGVAGLFPNLIPSSLDPAYSLTIFNSSSSPYTLKIMTAVAFIFVPIVIAYKIWVYRIFRAPVTEADVLNDTHAY